MCDDCVFAHGDKEVYLPILARTVQFHNHHKARSICAVIDVTTTHHGQDENCCHEDLRRRGAGIHRMLSQPNSLHLVGMPRREQAIGRVPASQVRQTPSSCSLHLLHLQPTPTTGLVRSIESFYRFRGFLLRRVVICWDAAHLTHNTIC